MLDIFAEVISEAVKKALEQCANQLKTKLQKKDDAKQVESRKKSLERYIPDVSRAVYGVLSGLKDFEACKKRCITDMQESVLDRVSKKQLLVSHFTAGLSKYVERLNQEEGLEYQMQTKEAQVEDILIGCVTKTNNTFTEPMKNDTCTITFLQ